MPTSLMTHCVMCHHEYGAWRPQCTACGHPTPREPAPRITPTEKRIRREVAVRVKRACATLCAFCQCRGAKDHCDECNALIHPFCRHLHKETHRTHTLRVTS